MADMRRTHKLDDSESLNSLPLVQRMNMETTPIMGHNQMPSALASRRGVLGTMAALLASTILGTPLRAQTASPLVQDPTAQPSAPAAAAPEVVAEPMVPQPFSFDIVSTEMQALATQPHQAGEKVTGWLEQLTYDDYKMINFRDDAARWQVEDSFFRVYGFHMGWLFAEPVVIHEVKDGQSLPMVFSTDDFDYYEGVRAKVPEHAPLPGVAGFKITAPLNNARGFDEVAAFLGASYFRALGRGNSYGLSARGLAINTALPSGEEFPRFTRFYLEKPAAYSHEMVVYAALESPLCTGAYRFVIRPGSETLIDVTARLYFRDAADEIGVAPLTSMFLYADKNRAKFDDYRPRVHDSDGLMIRRRDGDVIWRPLNNPPRLTGSYFTEENPQSFGLMQRTRGFENYQDASAHYEKRPSLLIEPIGDWGRGAVRLVEIPTDLEVNDNIVAFWVPEAKVQAGDAREFSYRMHWGTFEPNWDEDLAFIIETRSGVGGVSGVTNDDGSRKFVVDFAGGLLASLPGDAEVEAVVNIANGEIVTQTLSKVEGEPIWRLVLDLKAGRDAVVELQAHVKGYGRKLTENWLYQWTVA